MKYTPQELMEKYPQLFDIDWEHDRTFIHYPDGHVRILEKEHMSLNKDTPIGYKFYSSYLKKDCVVVEKSEDGMELWVE